MRRNPLFMDGGAVGSIVGGNCQRHCPKGVGWPQRVAFLDDTFAEGFLSDEDTAAGIFHRARDDFRSTRAVFIHQDNQRNLLSTQQVRARRILLIKHMPPFVAGRDDEAFVNEGIGDVIGDVEKPTLIVPQIQNECLHARGLMCSERIVKFLFCAPFLSDKLLNVDIAD